MTYQDWTGAQNGLGSMLLFNVMRWLVTGTQRKDLSMVSDHQNLDLVIENASQ